MKTNLKGDHLAIAELQDLHQPDLLARKNITGVGIGNKIRDGRDTGDPCLTVFVEQKLDKAILSREEIIPSVLGKFKTDVIESGVIFAGSNVSLTERIRPVKGGYSVGHYKITAGTIATCVTDAAPTPGIPSMYYILSNNHVLANSNDAKIGDPILQPGSYDGGVNPGDIVAKLSRYVPIKFDGTDNYVDCAIAEGDLNILNREIYWIGHVKGTAAAQIGMMVHKTGRTTGHTSGKITSINATVNVNYGGGHVGKFVDQIITTSMSAPGDSGSLVLEDSGENAVGLLFAGSASITILNNIARVLKYLSIKFH